MEITWLFVMLASMLAFVMPVAIALAGSSAIFIFVNASPPLMVVAHRMINGVDSFPLLAVRFFILAGNLMNTAGITERIFNFALALVGWMRGGLGHVNVGAWVVVAGMPGAAVADAGGFGAIETKRCETPSTTRSLLLASPQHRPRSARSFHHRFQL